MISSPNRRCLLSLIALLAAAALFGHAAADIGHWTPTSNWSEQEQARYAVHMMLLRGDNSPFHSRILWFQGEVVAQDTLWGGEWGWTPGGDDFSSYPTSHFVRLGLNHSGMNGFCGGHAILNGRVLLSGGDDPEVQDYGEIRARIFTAGSGSTRGAWSPVPDMHYRRFYPTVVALRDGRGLVVAGSQYRHHRIFGPLQSGDTLRRFAPIPGGRWDSAVLPAADPAPGAGVPTHRFGHTAVQMEYVYPFAAQVYFGGQDSQGLRKNDTWLQRFWPSDNLLASDGPYSWVKPTIAGGPPALRTDHSAIVVADTTMVVFGGLGVSDTVFSDVWRLSYDRNPPATYRWNKITKIGGTWPPARYGHSAIYDTTFRSTAAGDTLRRMIVFGGASVAGQNPTDQRVWELRFVTGKLDTATWYNMTQVDLSTGVVDEPAPRLWHTMNEDQAVRARDAGTTACHAALMYGGRLDASTCSDTLWKLWTFRDGTVGWEKVTPGGTYPPGARARHSTVLDPDQSGYSARIYVYGGTLGNGNPTDSRVYVLDPWGGQYTSWTQWSDLGVSLAGHTAVLEHDQQQVRTAEVFSPVDTTWHEHSSATLWEQFYPPVFLVPGGGGGKSRVINVGDSGRQTYSLDIPPAGESATESWAQFTSDTTGFLAQTGVQYRPGHIMLAGGRDLNGVAAGTTRTIDALNPSAGWLPSDNMLARLDANLVLLPTGSVLAVGGNRTGVSGDPVKWPQMWDPAGNSGAGTWSTTDAESTRLAQQPTIRPNHSTAILLPDGRVLSAGGDGAHEDTTSDQHTGEIFYPPYLFHADNTTLSERPTFSNSAKPESLGFGKIFTICVPDTAGITRACLIRPGATTHAVDMNQRYVPLNFTTAGSPMRLFVTSPASPDSAPPGDYMLFLTGKDGYRDVPSIAKWVRVVATGLDSCDSVWPKAMTDLDFDVDETECTLFHLHWTAPGDDSSFAASGPATQYNMKVSSSSITTNWTGGTTLSLVPGAAGTTQTADVVVGADQSRYIRIKTKDDNNNWSWISNQIHISGPPSNSDCLGGDGMLAGGGGGGGDRARPAAGPASALKTAVAELAENTLLSGVAQGTRGADMLRLPALASSAGSSYSVRIREARGHASRMDEARLLTVDHSSSVSAFIASGRPVLGNRVPPVHAIDGSGTEVTSLVNGSTTETFVGDSAATITVQLRADSSVTADPVVVEASGLGWISSGILVQVPDGAGGWRTMERLRPRLHFDDLAVDSVGSAHVRLFFLGRHRVRFVGRLTRSEEQPTLQWAELLRAQASSHGDVLPSVSASDTASVTLAGPDTLLLSFAVPPLAGDQSRECFLAVEATPLAPDAITASPMRASGIASLPTRFALWQNQPNPFSASTTIRFDLPVGAMVRLEIFDVQGRRVKAVANHYYPAGYQAVQWDRRDEGGGAARPSVYLYRLTAGAFRAQKKMVLLP